MSAHGFEGSVALGEYIGQYRIDAVAGRGGMGLVYRAWDERLQRAVAIKMIAPHVATAPEFRARFEQESLLAAQIEHPNVIPVYEVGEHEGSVFLVTRFVEGVDLGQLLRQSGRLEPRAAAAIVVQIAAALDAAHAKGLVHRDVKPGNVLVSGEPGSEHVYLTDFGISKRMAQTSGGFTATGALLGTIDYAAPEQLLGRPVDARTDVYALGCVLYQLLTGSVPFTRDTDAAKVFAHVSDAPPAAGTLVPGLPSELEGVLAKAMAKDPDDRYPSAGDLGRAAVAGAEGRVSGEPTRSVAVGPAAAGDVEAVDDAETVAAAPSERPATRHTRWRLLGAVLVVVAVAAVLAIVLSRGGGGGAAAPADVARAWVAAYNASDFAKGASYFKTGAKVNGSTFTTRAQFIELQAGYKCALKVSSLSAQGKKVTIRAVNVAGPGRTHACKGYVGSTDAIVLRVDHGKIVEFSLG